LAFLFKVIITMYGTMNLKNEKPSQYSDCLLAGGFGNRIPVGAKFFAPVLTGPGAHPASCTMGTGSFPGVKSGRGVTLTTYPLLVPWSWKGTAIPLLPLWAVRPVQSLSTCKRVHFTDIIYQTCIYNRLPEEEHSVSKRVEDIKKLQYKTFKDEAQIALFNLLAPEFYI